MKCQAVSAEPCNTDLYLSSGFGSSSPEEEGFCFWVSEAESSILAMSRQSSDTLLPSLHHCWHLNRDLEASLSPWTFYGDDILQLPTLETARSVYCLLVQWGITPHSPPHQAKNIKSFQTTNPRSPFVTLLNASTKNNMGKWVLRGPSATSA